MWEICQTDGLIGTKCSTHMRIHLGMNIYKSYPLDTPGAILRGLCGQKLKSGKCGQTAGLIAGCCVCPRNHTINNFMVSPVNWVRIPMVAGFVVLCGANIVGNIISAEKRCNYPARSRVTRLVLYIQWNHSLRSPH